MLKIRVMPTLLYRDFTLVKGERFDSWRRVGSAMQAIKVYEMRKVDELVFLDISATVQGRGPDIELIDELADWCFMPLTVGGGISTIDQVRAVLLAGADKVAINSAAHPSTELVSAVAKRFGTQCVVSSVDFRRESDGSCQVYTHAGTVATGVDPVSFARRVYDAGAGEILLTSIDRDGTMQGYDVEITAAVSDAVGIPVIASGGCGGFEHMESALSEGGALAVAAASIFHFTERTPLEAKTFLAERGFPMRLTS